MTKLTPSVEWFCKNCDKNQQPEQAQRHQQRRMKRDSKVNPVPFDIHTHKHTQIYFGVSGRSIRKRFTCHQDETVAAQRRANGCGPKLHRVHNLMNFTLAIMKRKSWVWKKKSFNSTTSGPEERSLQMRLLATQRIYATESCLLTAKQLPTVPWRIGRWTGSKKNKHWADKSWSSCLRTWLEIAKLKPNKVSRSVVIEGKLQNMIQEKCQKNWTPITLFPIPRDGAISMCK